LTIPTIVLNSVRADTDRVLPGLKALIDMWFANVLAYENFLVHLVVLVRLVRVYSSTRKAGSNERGSNENYRRY
jgi:hypothetical protein